MRIFEFIKRAFSGKGYRAYSSKEAQLKYADTILSLYEKVLLIPFPLLLAFMFDHSAVKFIALFFLIVICFFLSIYFRDQALVIYDLHGTPAKETKELSKL